MNNSKAIPKNNIEIIENEFMNEKYGISGKVQDLLYEISDTIALIRFSYEIGNEIGQSYAESRLADIAFEKNEIELLNLIVLKTSNNALRANVENRLEILTKVSTIKK